MQRVVAVRHIACVQEQGRERSTGQHLSVQGLQGRAQNFAGHRG